MGDGGGGLGGGGNGWWWWWDLVVDWWCWYWVVVIHNSSLKSDPYGICEGCRGARGGKAITTHQYSYRHYPSPFISANHHSSPRITAHNYSLPLIIAQMWTRRRTSSRRSWRGCAEASSSSPSPPISTDHERSRRGARRRRRRRTEWLQRRRREGGHLNHLVLPQLTRSADGGPPPPQPPLPHPAPHPTTKHQSGLVRAPRHGGARRRPRAAHPHSYLRGAPPLERSRTPKGSPNIILHPILRLLGVRSRVGGQRFTVCGISLSNKRN